MKRLKGFKQDIKARALSFFANSNTVVVSQKLIDELKQLSAENGNCNARLCLHTAPDSSFHEMIVLEREGFYFPPHRHTNKGESCHIIEGELAVFTFDDAGKVTHHTVLGKDGNITSRVGIGQFHLTLALTDPVIYHETKPGPFVETTNSAFASWAPARDDTKGGYLYLQGLLAENPV